MKKTSRLERLARKEEQETVRKIIRLSIVSLVLVIFFLSFGASILGKFADFLGIFFGKNGENVSMDATVRPPRIDPLVQATNSAKLAVLGFSGEGTKVEIYRQEEKVGEAEVKNGKFIFENLQLEVGENRISAKAVNSLGKTSDFSDTENVIFDNSEPNLEIAAPRENQSFVGNNRIKISGKVDKDSQAYANGFLANVDYDGNFEVFVPLTEGENIIEVKALDSAGNSKVEKRKVTFRK